MVYLRHTLLLISDAADVQASVNQTLYAHVAPTVELTSCVSLAAALPLLRAQPIALVLLDDRLLASADSWRAAAAIAYVWPTIVVLGDQAAALDVQLAELGCTAAVGLPELAAAVQMTLTPLPHGRADRTAQLSAVGREFPRYAEMPEAAPMLDLYTEAHWLKHVQRIAALGAWAHDARTQAVTWSPQMYQIFGLAPGETEASLATLTALIHPDDRAAWQSSLQRHTPGIVQHPDVRIVRPDGAVRIISRQAETIRDAAGEILRVVGTMLDVTEQRAAEQALRDAELRYRLLVEQLPAIIYTVSSGTPSQGLYVSPQVTQTLGYTPAEWIADPELWTQLINPDDRAAVGQAMADVLQSGAAQTIEVRLRGRDGREVWLRNTFAPGQTDADGVPLLHGIAFDITEQQRVEQALRRSEARLKRAQAIAQLGSWEWDLAANTVDWSDEVAKIFGCTPAEVTGSIMALFSRIHPEDQVTAAALRPQPGAEPTLILRIVQPDGQLRWVAVHAETICDATGQPMQMVGTLHDITEHRERAEQLRQLSLAVEASPVSVMITNTEPHITYVNPAFTALTGYTAEEAIGQHPRFLRVTQSSSAPYSELWRTVRSGDAWSGVLESRRKNGESYWEAISVAPLAAADGAITHFVAMQQDITERTRAEAALSEQRAHLVRAQRIAQLGSWSWDLQRETFTWSDELVRIFGLPASETSPDWAHIRPMLHPDDAPLLEASFAELRSGAVVTDFQTRLVRPSGELRHLQVQAEILADASGTPAQIVGTVLDVTERTRAEAALRTSQERLAGIVTSAMDAVISVDDQQRIVLFNPAAERMFGYTEGALLGQPLVQLLPARFRAGHQAHVRRFARTGTTSRRTGVVGGLWGLRANGEEFPIEASVSHVDVAGERLATVILRDVTDLRRAEAELQQANEVLEERVAQRTLELQAAKDEAERANRAKSEFLSRMSHELRTPMNSILGFAQIMELDGLPGKQAERLGHVMTAGQHLLRLINEVLDMARVEEGRLALALEPVGVRGAIEQAVALVKPLAAQRNQHLLVRDAPATDVYVQADQQRLVQVLLNFLSNAAKYSIGGDTIVVAVEQRPEQRVRISVRDHGPGIPAAQHARLFQPFERLGVTSAVEGTGLGLALSRRLAVLMGGAVGVDSAPGAGSCFWVELVAADASIWPQPAVAAAPRALQAQPVHTILYIDNHLSTLHVIEHLLDDIPELQLISAMQGKLGLELAREHQPSLILLDLHLPDMSGDEVLRQLMADPVTAATPVVMLSADASPLRVRALLSAGAADYLTKPLDVQQFLECIRGLLAAS